MQLLKSLASAFGALGCACHYAKVIFLTAAPQPEHMVLLAGLAGSQTVTGVAASGAP